MDRVVICTVVLASCWIQEEIFVLHDKSHFQCLVVLQLQL